MGVAETMRERLTAAFAPARLEIKDESARHAGHAGARPEGESHFRVVIVSEAFRSMSRVERHRAVHDVLAQQIRNNVHALALKVLTPEEDRDN